MSTIFNKLFQRYRFLFEGIANPVFYYDMYPTSFNVDKMTQELWDKYNFGKGLKEDRNSQELFEKNQKKYLRILYDFIECINSEKVYNNIGIFTIPSSKKDIINKVTKITQKVISDSCFSNLTDLTNNFTRIETKEASHETGNRDINSNIQTLCFSKNVNLNAYDAILVIDDIVTSGNSFLSIQNIMDSKNFAGDIFNFAFSKSTNHMAIDFYGKQTKNFVNIEEKDSRPVSGIVFDFDQTLINDHYRNIDFESGLHQLNTNSQSDFQTFLDNNEGIYDAYSGIEDFQRKNIPFTIVTNSYIKRIDVIFQLKNILRNIYPYTYDAMFKVPTNLSKYIHEKYNDNVKYGNHNGGKLFRIMFNRPNNIFSTPYETVENTRIRYPKPNPKVINQSIEWLNTTFNLTCNDRIIGVGNTIEDIIAYNEAKIESILGLWGVPSDLRSNAKEYWPANHVFETFTDFSDWVTTTKYKSLNFDSII
ncbi:hypothetical protein [Leuconostoc mesenteroides]|uniref:hypothetical protein n=1 Tax=Leuconostoc mesenteroides TaxID=1245 RepID=UPI00235FB40F|nr:hypothetical protein [Leuconostoc mesenteroides]